MILSVNVRLRNNKKSMVFSGIRAVRLIKLQGFQQKTKPLERRAVAKAFVLAAPAQVRSFLALWFMTRVIKYYFVSVGRIFLPTITL